MTGAWPMLDKFRSVVPTTDCSTAPRFIDQSIGYRPVRQRFDCAPLPSIEHQGWRLTPTVLPDRFLVSTSPTDAMTLSAHLRTVFPQWESKQPPEVSDIFPQTVGNYQSKFCTPTTRSYLRKIIQIFIQLPSNVTN